MRRAADCHHKLFGDQILNSFMQYSAHRLLKAWRRTTHVAAAVLFVAGCGGGSGDDDDDLILTDTGQDGRIAQMRFINMIPDSPIVEMLHEGTSSARFTELLPFGTGSNRNDFITGDFFFNFSFVNGAGQRITLFEQSDFPLEDGNEHNFIMTGTLADSRLIRLDNPEFLVGLDDATADVDPQIQFIHTAVGIGSIDFYLTEVDADISTATPLATLAFGENSAIFDTTETDTAQLRAFEAGSTENLLFDSGATPIARTTRTLIMASNYFGPVGDTDNSGVELLRFGRTPIGLSNANQPASLRVHNLIADTNGVDIYFGDPDGTPDIPNVEFRSRTEELLVDPQFIELVVTTAGNSADVILELNNQPLSGGTRNTLYLGGEASDPDNENIPNIGTTLAVENNRRIAEGVPLRLFNGSTTTASLNVFLLRPGQDIENSTPNNLLMGGYTGISVVTGEFDIVIEETINRSTVFGPERIIPDPGTALNIVIRDTFGGTTPIQVDLVTDPTQAL